MHKLEQFYRDLQSHTFVKFLENPKKLVFYGAGRVCERLLESIKEYCLPIKLIVDAHKDGEMRGISVVKKDIFFSSGGDYDYRI